MKVLGLECVNRIRAAAGGLLHSWIRFAAHCSLAVRAVDFAACIAKEGTTPGAAVRLGRSGELKFRRCAQSAGSGDHIAEGVAILRACCELRVQKSCGIRVCRAARWRAQSVERIRQSRVRAAI